MMAKIITVLVFVFLIVKPVVADENARIKDRNITSKSAIDISFDSYYFSNFQQHKLTKWIKQTIVIVEDSIGKIPVSNYQVKLFHRNSKNGPVPWAEVVRNSNINIRLHVNKNATLDALINDWTLYHEISHLYLPYLDYPSFWLNEGFATYMQYVTMLNGKIISPKQFVTNMQTGFKRGAMKTEQVKGKLSDVSEDMWQKRAYRRVYWTGAAFFTAVDHRLINKGTNLTTVVSNYSKCCLTEDAEGEELMQVFDEISNSTIFSTTYKQYQHRTDFPKTSENVLNTISMHYGKDQKH